MSNITVGNEKNILFYSDENGKTKSGKWIWKIQGYTR